MEDANTETTPILDTIETYWKANKSGGTAGRWFPTIVRDDRQFETIAAYRETSDADKAIERSFEGIAGTADDDTGSGKALLCGFELWPHVHLSFDERVEMKSEIARKESASALVKKLAKIPIVEAQWSRAYVAFDACPEVSLDEHFKAIQAVDKAAVEAAKAAKAKAKAASAEWKEAVKRNAEETSPDIAEATQEVADETKVEVEDVPESDDGDEPSGSIFDD